MSLVALLAAAAALALIQAAVFRTFGLKRLKYRRYFEPVTAYEGQRVAMVEELSNAKPLPMLWLKVEARMPPELAFGRQDNLTVSGGAYHLSVFSMGPWRKITRTHTVTCMKRGCYKIESVSMTSGDLAGIGERSMSLETPMELLVYPRVLDFASIDAPSQRWQGDVITRRFVEPDPFLINGIRAFEPGDMLRDVHWPATAKTGELKVKTRDYTASPRLLLVVNVQLYEDQWGELNDQETPGIERSLSLAATWADWATKNGVETGFLCNGRFGPMDDRPVETPMGAGPAHLMEMLEAMARLKILRRRSFARYLDDEVLPRGLTGADFAVFSHYWGPGLEERAGRLRRMGNSVTWVNPDGGSHA